MAAEALGLKQAATAGGSVVKTYYLPLNKLDATAAPGVGNDDSQGYVAGSLWVDRTHHAVYVCESNATGGAVWGQVGEIEANDVTLIYSQTSVPNGDTIANTIAITKFSVGYTIPANTLAAGDVIRITLRGVYGTKAVSPGTLELQINTAGGVTQTLLTTGSFTPAANLANRGWVCEALLTVQTPGSGGLASAPVECQGEARFVSGTGTAQVFDMSLTGGAGNTAPVTVDLTVNQALNFTVVWGTANSANTITLRETVIEHGSAT